MDAWSIVEHARGRCAELRAQAARERLARAAGRVLHTGARRRIARVLVAVGSMIVAAGSRFDSAPAA